MNKKIQLTQKTLKPPPTVISTIITQQCIIASNLNLVGYTTITFFMKDGLVYTYQYLIK